MVYELSPDDMLIIKNTPRNELRIFHLDLGLWIRNNFGLWSGNTDLMLSTGPLVFLPDEASSIIIEALWERLHQDVRIKEALIYSSFRS